MTHQARLPFAQLVLASYQRHWPDNRLVFRIPYNGTTPGSGASQNVEFVPAESPLTATMTALLNKIPDDEFVYWCTDDRYLARIYDKGRLDELMAWMRADAPKPFDSLRLVNHTPRALRASRIHQHKAPLARGFWHHQFIRAGVLRRMFVESAPADIATPTRELLNGNHVHIAYSAVRSIVQFAEPTIGPEITANGEADCRRYGIELPDGFGRTGTEQFFPPNRRNPIAWLSR